MMLISFEIQSKIKTIERNWDRSTITEESQTESISYDSLRTGQITNLANQDCAKQFAWSNPRARIGSNNLQCEISQIGLGQTVCMVNLS